MNVKAANPPSIGSDAFYNVSNNIPVYVPCEGETAYQNALGWNYFNNIIVKGPYNITLHSNNNSMGTATITQQLSCTNNTAVIHAIPNTGYHFVQWNDDDTQNPRTITVTQDTNFTAIFEVVPVYHVTVTANNSNMGTVTGGGDFPKNTAVTIKATPEAGFRFVHWNDGNTQNQRTIMLAQDTSFMAIFAVSTPNTYHVTVVANNNSMGTLAGDGDYTANTTATIVAFPNAGYRFVHWDDGNTLSSYTFTVTRDMLFTATFESETGITDIETSAINIYPNPTTDNIRISLPENVYHAVFTLYDMQGKELIRREINNEDVVSVSTFAIGIYIYNVRTEKENHTGKLICK
jgi:hypothetical protein